jgi:hypothetical protein
VKRCAKTIPLSPAINLSLLLSWLVLALPVTVLGQAPSSVVQEQIRKLDFLIGEWKGKGWMYRLDGSRSVELSQSTIVKRSKDGLNLSIKDTKRAGDMHIVLGQPFPNTVLNYPMSLSATISVYYDEGAKLYFWRVETPAGRKSPFKARLTEPGVFQWKLEFPGSLSIITIKVTGEGEWHEIQELWMGDKDGWFKTQETILKKVK